MCRDGKSLAEIGLAHQQVQDLGARVEAILQHLQSAAVQAVALREALWSAERTLAETEASPGTGVTVTPVPASHADPT